MSVEADFLENIGHLSVENNKNGHWPVGQVTDFYGNLYGIIR